MKITTASVMTAGTLGVAGLVSAGLFAFPTSASGGGAADDQWLKRDDDTPDVVLVADDDDDDTNARDAQRADRSDNTGTRSKNTRSNNTRSQTSTRDRTGTGARTGLDRSVAKQYRDVTTDGPGKKAWDRSANSTNDRSRHNTRR